MSLKILLIDDQLGFIDQLREQLTTLPYSDNIQVIQATNSEEGKEQFINNPDLDLVVIDVHLGDEDGVKLAREFSTSYRDRLESTKLLMTCTEAPKPLRDECKSYDVSGWVLKPIEGKTLYQFIKTHLPHRLV